MSSTAITTVVEMLESLPDSVQDQVLNHLREYLTELQEGLDIPNSVTRQTFEDTDAGKNLVRAKNGDELFHKLGI